MVTPTSVQVENAIDVAVDRIVEAVRFSSSIRETYPRGEPFGDEYDRADVRGVLTNLLKEVA